MSQLSEQAQRTFEQILAQGGVKLPCGCLVPVDPEVLRALRALHGNPAVFDLVDSAVRTHTCPKSKP